MDDIKAIIIGILLIPVAWMMISVLTFALKFAAAIFILKFMVPHIELILRNIESLTHYTIGRLTFKEKKSS